LTETEAPVPVLSVRRGFMVTLSSAALVRDTAMAFVAGARPNGSIVRSG
jgi:hypothetical protein